MATNFFQRIQFGPGNDNVECIIPGGAHALSVYFLSVLLKAPFWGQKTRFKVDFRAILRFNWLIRYHISWSDPEEQLPIYS